MIATLRSGNSEQGSLASMAQRPLEQLTFREKIRDCTHRTHELIEHVEQNLVPRIDELQSQLKPPKTGHEDDVTDISVRNLVASTLESQRYGSQMEDEIDAYGNAINAELGNMLNLPST
jgi:hypothetical protein